MNKAKLDLFSDLTYFETGTRGRVSYISKRYSNAKNKYLLRP